MLLNAESLIGLGRVTAFDVHPDGTWLAVQVDRADTEHNRYESELWRVGADGREAHRLLEGAFGDRAPRFATDGSLLFLSKRTHPDHGPEDRADDDGFAQVWSWRDGTLSQVTDEPLGLSQFKESHGRIVGLTTVLPDVEHSQQREAMTTRKKRGPSMLHYRDMPARLWDHWRGPAVHHLVMWQGDVRTDLTPDATRMEYVDAAFDIARDGSSVLVTCGRVRDSRIVLSHLVHIDLERNHQRLLLDLPGLSIESPLLSPNGRCAVVRSARIDFEGIHQRHLALVNLETATHRLVATDWDRDPKPAVWVDDHTVAVTADDAGHVPVFAINTDNDSVHRLTADGGCHSTACIREDVLYTLTHALLAPPEVARTPITGGSSQRVTELTGLAPEALTSALVVEHAQVPSTDGVQVPVFTVRRRDRQDPGPALLWIHGGPRGQWGEMWHWRWNAALAALAGYVVALPNPRGSTGLGQAFFHGIWGNQWGGQCYRDLMCVADHLESRPDVDPDRICAMGGSFGGYMTCWIGTQTDRFRCLITHAPVYAFGQFQVTTDLPAWWVLESGTDAWRDRDLSERYSPDRFVPSWTSPVLILHGEKDYRCPISESLALFEGLRRYDKPAELIVFPDENHWILKPSNIVAWYGAVLAYLKTHLGD